MSKPLSSSCWTALSVCFSVFLLGFVAAGSSASDLLPPGFRPLPLGVHALVGGKIVIKPGEVLEGGTVVIRDGFIKAVGKEVGPPADARLRDIKRPTCYAGFIHPSFALRSTN